MKAYILEVGDEGTESVLGKVGAEGGNVGGESSCEDGSAGDTDSSDKA